MFQSKESNSLKIYKYDLKNNLTETTNYFCGKLSGKTKNVYDENGYNIETRKYKENGDLSTIYFNKFDIRGNKIETRCLNKFGNLSHRITVVYDEKGNELSDFWDDSRNPDIYSSKHIYKYDYNGNKIETKYYRYPDYNLKQIDEYKYDSFGNMTADLNVFWHLSESKNFKNDEVLGSYYKYEYDYLNNWTKKLKYNNFILDKITERTIEYYPD